MKNLSMGYMGLRDQCLPLLPLPVGPVTSSHTNIRQDTLDYTTLEHTRRLWARLDYTRGH